MRSMPGWWVRKREAARQRKTAIKNRLDPDYPVKAQAEWEAWPDYTKEAAPELVPYTPDPAPSSWYQFCTDRKFAYESRGDHVAAMVYWALRSFDMTTRPCLVPGKEAAPGDDVDPNNPCTDEGYQALCDYWAYKMDAVESGRI